VNSYLSKTWAARLFLLFVLCSINFDVVTAEARKFQCSTLFSKSTSNIDVKNWKTPQKRQLLNKLLSKNLVLDVQMKDTTWVTGIIHKPGRTWYSKKNELFLVGSITPSEIIRIRVYGSESEFKNVDGVSLLPVDLKFEVQQSTIPKKYLDLMKQYRAKMITLPDLLRTNKPGDYDNLLGLDTEEYGYIADFAKLERFEVTYKKMNVDWEVVENHSEILMEHLSDKGTVFLIPRSLFSYDTGYQMDGKNITRVEFLWLMKNPSHMRNVTFVFGGYNSIVTRPSAKVTNATLKKLAPP